MALSINQIGMYRLLLLNPGEGYLEYRKPFQSFRTLDKEEVADQNNIIKIIDDDFKILFALHPRMFHLFIDNLSLIIIMDAYYKKQRRKFSFVLETSDIPPSWFDGDGPTYFTFFLKVLTDLEINYIFIRSRSIESNNKQVQNDEAYPNKDLILQVNNYALWNPQMMQEQQLAVLSKLFKKYLPKDKTIIPNKTVYLSRASVSNSANWVANARTEGEESLVDFFKNFGCEIVAAENFKTFEEQIEYFNSVKTLIGLTGSGLINMLMMQDEGNVIELFTPIGGNPFNPNTLTVTHELSLHSFYRDFSWVKGHTHISIKNLYKSKGSDLVELLKNNEWINQFFKRAYHE